MFRTDIPRSSLFTFQPTSATSRCPCHTQFSTRAPDTIGLRLSSLTMVKLLLTTLDGPAYSPSVCTTRREHLRGQDRGTGGGGGVIPGAQYGFSSMLRSAFTVIRSSTATPLPQSWTSARRSSTGVLPTPPLQ